MFRRPDNPGRELSRVALKDAVMNLRKVQARHSEVQEVSTALREMRERNHFAESLMTLMGGTHNEGSAR